MLFAVVCGLLLLPLAPAAWGASSNLLPNGSFQSGTTGWSATSADFTIASDGYDGDGAAARLALNTTATRYTLNTKPRPVQSTTAGTVYTANGVVRSDTPGKKVCLVVKEIASGGALVQAKNSCATTTLQWGPFPQVALTAQNAGDQIDVTVRQTSAASGDSFEVDTLSLAANAGDTTAPTTPTNVNATAVSSSEIDVSWSASSDPDFGGVAGYAVYRDGGSSAIGTVSGSTTAFADRSLGPDTTHTYTVAAFDAAGNYSPQSAASNPATTLSAPQSAVVGSWHLDETSGTTAYDSSGFGHNGSISGPVTLGVPGEAGTAYSFVPKSTVIVPNAADLVPGTADVTISYWLKTSILPCCNGFDYDMFTKGDMSSQGGQIKIEVQENGQASCYFRGDLGSRQFIAGPNVVDGHWHHVICQRLGNQIVETVDGQTYSVTKATGNIAVTDQIRLGSHLNGGDWYDGILDEVTYSIGAAGGGTSPTITTSALGDATNGGPYSQSLAASGGSQPYTWSLSSGQLPPGLVLDSATGSISGTPTAVAGTTYQFTVAVTDGSSATDTRALSITVADPLQITTSTMQDAAENQSYSQGITATGGEPPYDFSVSSGNLPPGLVLDSASGVISGTPTAAGSYDFTVSVSDWGSPSRVAFRSLSISVAPTLAIAPQALPDGTVGVAYSAVLSARDGVQPYSWSLSGGRFPPGLVLDGSGTISGTPTKQGNYTFTVGVSDSAGATATLQLSIKISR